MNRSRRTSWRELVALVPLVCVPPMVLAGQPGWSILPLTIGAAFALGWVGWNQRHGVSLVAADIAVAACVLWTGFQLIPLPGIAHPEVRQSLALAGIDADWLPITLDPAGTKEKFIVAIGAFAAYLAARIAVQQTGRRALVYTVAISCSLVAAVAFGHEVVGATQVFGLYTPRDTEPVLMGPVLNSNQLGGFLAFGAVLWMGLSMTARGRSEAMGGATMTALCAIGALGSGSRGAALSLSIGVVAALVLSLRHAEGLRDRRRWVFGLGALVVTAALFAVTGFAGLWADIEGGDYSKVALIQDAAGFSLRAPLLGVGRGAFEAAFASHGGEVRFTHPENLLVQWGTEWGWPFTVLVGGVLIRYVGHAIRRGEAMAAFVAVALGALAVHELFDFALEMPGILVVVAVAAGGLGRSQHRRRRGGLRLRRLGTIGIAIAAVLLAFVIGWGTGDRRPTALRDQLAAAQGDQLAEVISEAVRAHPVDPQVAVAIGSALVRVEDPQALHWLNRAMVLAPSWSSPHLLAAYALARRGATTQALLEAHEAHRRHPGSAQEAYCWLAPRIQPERVAASVGRLPADEQGGAGERIARCLEGEVAGTFDDALIAASEDARAHLRRAARRLRAGHLEEAMADFAVARARLPELSENQRILEARIIAQTEGVPSALAQLSGDSWGIVAERALLAAQADDLGEVEGALSELRRQAAGEPTRMARAWAIAGRAYQRLGRDATALEAFERAARLDRQATSHLWSLARLAEGQGRRSQAMRAYQRLCDLGDRRGCVELQSP